MVAADSIYEFGPFRLEVSTRRLLRGGEPVSLAPKAFDVLVALIERRERVVDKAELMKLIWPDSFVEEANLSQTIFVLRKTLGEDSTGNQYIETSPRRGYRFTSPVREIQPVTVDATATAAPNPSTARWIWVAAGAAVLVVLAVIGAWRTRAASAPIRAIAVLPLSNLSGQEGEQYFADGLTEALTSDLAQIQSLRVVARTSTAGYRDTTKASAEVGRELGVDGLVTGSVVRSGDRVRVSVQLIEASNDRHVWARSYERQLAGILHLQREIARAVAEEVRAVLTPSERARLRQVAAVDPRAHDAYLRGRFELNKRTRDGFVSALAHFESAIAASPQYAAPHAGIADCYMGLAGFIHVRPREVMPRAIAAATRTLELDPADADALASLGYARFRYDYDWPVAEDAFKKAIGLNPNLASARQWYAMGLAWVGRLDESRLEMDRAVLIDPRSLVTLTFSGWQYFFARDYPRAIGEFDRVQSIDPKYVISHRRKGWALQMQGRHEEAIASFEQARGLSSGDLIETAALGRGYAMAGRRQEMLAIIKEMEQRDPGGELIAYSVAEIYAAAGDAANTVHWLERAYEARSIWFVFLKSEPVFDAVRSHPGFQPLVDRIRW